MAGVKIATFLGKAPKISPELLPNTAAQIAENCKLYSGDLIPYPQPVVVGNTQRTGTIKTLYALRNPDNTNDLKWLSWTTDVDIAVASSNLQDEQRFYYSGDGAPKVSNYELATTGAGAYPINYYELGLPIPEDSQKLTTVAATFTTKNVSSYARDAGNVATLVTTGPHGLRSGNSITISEFTYFPGTYNQPGGTTNTITIAGHGLSNGAQVTLDFTSGNAIDGTYTISNVTPTTFDITAATAATTSGNVRLSLASFNATNVECTVVNSTTFTYFSPGPPVATTSTLLPSISAKVNLGGLTQARSYVFTWYTPWEEESIASKPSDNLYIKEGIQVTVSNIPTTKPAGNNFVRGVRLYRTLASTSGTEYFRLATLWFPNTVVAAQRLSGTVRVTLQFPHNLGIDDRFKTTGTAAGAFDITGGVVTDIIDDTTFEFAQAGGDTGVILTGGTLYYDVAETLDKPARYWGDGSYDFLDDFDSRNLLDILDSDEYDPPPDDLQGLTTIKNNILVGFVGNTLYFSEPALPHAWPIRYATPVGEDIVALAAIAGSLLVLTKGYPYLVATNDPASGVSADRIDVLYSCLSAKSVVSMGYGIVYSTNDGLAVFSPNTGGTLITKALYNNDTWQTDIDPTTVVAEYYGENYFASHSQGSFVFEQDAKVGGFFVDTAPVFSASWYDTQTGKLYYCTGTLGDVYEWDDLSQPALTMEWKSKVIVTKDMINLGAARVIADYSTVTKTWDNETRNWESALTNWNNADEITFRLWANKELILTTTVNDTEVFRLPTGYRTDTFEVGVEGNVRVRAIHLAETPLGLREV
jgi:hypothetical protein